MGFRQPEICIISPGPIPEKADQKTAHGNVIMCDDHSEYRPEVLNIAKKNYEQLFDVNPDTSTQQQIDRSSLTVPVWLACDIREYQSIAQDRAHRDAREEAARSQEKSVGGGCWAFGSQNGRGAVDQNVQVAKLIVALGEHD